MAVGVLCDMLHRIPSPEAAQNRDGTRGDPTAARQWQSPTPARQNQEDRAARLSPCGHRNNDSVNRAKVQGPVSNLGKRPVPAGALHNVYAV